MLEYTNGRYSEIDFANHLEHLDYYSRKARLLHKIDQHNQLIDSGLTESRVKLELELETLRAELESMTPPSPKT